jgi:multidrug efflux system outer membrane protein
MRKFLWSLTLLILLAGCLRPHYDPQYVDIPDDWRVDAVDESTLCNMSWWEQFDDPVLNQLILIALKNNQDIRVAISRVVQFYTQYRVISSSLYPNVTGSASYNRLESSIAVPFLIGTGLDRINDDFLASLNFNWELDFWGRLYSASEASYADLLSRVQARRAVVLTVVTSVANAYFTLRQLDAQLEISKKTLESRLESLKLAQDRFMLGETSELEVKQAESEAQIAVVSMIAFERDIPQQENLLSILLGENPHSIQRGLAIESFQYPGSIPVGLPSELLVRRPDIMQVEYDLIAANARVTEARALYFPQITLTAVQGSESAKFRKFLTSPAEFWQYGVGAVQTIFDAGRIIYLVEEAKAFRDEILFTYRQTILNAFKEVDSALIACQKNQQLVVEQRKQVSILTDVLHLAQLRYSEGEVDYLNVLDAERNLFDAQLTMTQFEADNFNAVVQLYGALGGGWIVEADTIALD